ncbi:MAG: hypothetical protein QOK79_01735 [Nitrososphaeraceae archaeon]|nr:hypothetical protein [Nitrososphaeraceae archaeon]MDW0188719.1 hypothetical protein [Nitrososphaeraceae archaeon]MDW0206074.1 hypothetical protein [Nitrososphaeraceae archaeon]MDW0224655.1 hypothetical protein [Nitrososphaeraceae archaeon]MDW0230900.1 hypothetical protein [Nitrososphaeraceae archaeon]
MMQLWVELFLRIDLLQKEKEESGKYLDKNLTAGGICCHWASWLNAHPPVFFTY